MKLNDFVSLKSELDGVTEDDVGKLTYFDDEIIIVSFFDDPSQAPVEKTFKISNNFSTEEYIELILEYRDLTKQTRIYMYDNETASWHVGRVVSQDMSHVECTFPNNSPPKNFYPNKDLFVRWNKPIKDPLSYLKNKIIETKYLSDKREQYSQFMIKQRSISMGIPSIMSSLIDLEDYQIEIVSRVLKDPIQRYLLSDEVGLGKTIEAGIILKQFVNDTPKNHKTLIIAPPTLVIQWKRELEQRFFLSSEIENRTIDIFSFDDFDQIKNIISSVKMIIIDEAHHLNRRTHENLYNLIDQNCRDLKRFLILSATPVYNNELNYFEMLHLLDPVVYPLENFERFKTLIANRQGLAENIAALDPLNVLDMHDELNNLKDYVEDETALLLIEKLEGVLDEFPDSEDPKFLSALDELRAFLSETYKLDRRILGTRRDQAKSSINISRKGIKFLDINSYSVSELISKVDDYRISKSIVVDKEAKEYKTWKEFFKKIIEHVLERNYSTEFLEKFQTNSSNNLDEEDNKNINEIILKFRELSQNKNYLDVLDKLIAESSEKFILFCSSSSVARTLHSHLLDKFPDKNPLRYEFARDQTESDNAFVQFQEDQNVKLIVCDKSSEEGINLQGLNRNIVHIDLPLNPNRIEQRIGRVDRFGNSEFNIYALRDLDNDYEKIWYEFLENTLQIFLTSAASLQILLEQEMKILHDDFFIKGIDVFHELTKKMHGEEGLINLEKKRINHQDQLNSMMFIKDDKIENLVLEDLEYHEIKNTIFDWLCDTLLINTDDASIKFIVRENSELTTVKELFDKYRNSRLELKWSGVGRNTLDQMNLRILENNITPRFRGNQDTNLLFNWLLGDEIDVLVISSSHHRRLNLRKCRMLEDGTVLGGETFRFEMGNNSLIPLDLFFDSFDKTIDKNNSTLNNPRVLRSYEYTSRRQTALNELNKGKSVRLLRLGDDFIEGLNSLFINDDRGKSFAIWRYDPNYSFEEPVELFFSLSFTVEGDIEMAENYYKSQSQSYALETQSSFRRKVDSDFPPMWQKVWLNSDFKNVEEKPILKLLNSTLNKKNDKNFTPKLWNIMKNKLLLLQNWEQTLDTVFENSISIIENLPNYIDNIEEGLKRFKKSTDLVNAQNKARIQYVDEDRVEFEKRNAEIDEHINEYIREGISRPKIKLENVGVVFLSKFPMQNKLL